MLHVCARPRRNPSMSIASISVLHVMKPLKLTVNGLSTPFFHRFVVYTDSTYFCNVRICAGQRMSWCVNHCESSHSFFDIRVLIAVQTLDPIRFCGQFVANARILAKHYCTWTTGAVTLLRKVGACLSWYNYGAANSCIRCGRMSRGGFGH